MRVLALFLSITLIAAAEARIGETAIQIGAARARRLGGGNYLGKFFVPRGRTLSFFFAVVRLGLMVATTREADLGMDG